MNIFHSIESVSSSPQTVILIHGSSLIESTKDMKFFRSWGRVLVASGFDTIVFNWRLDENSEEMVDLIAYVREHAESLKINNDNICLFAFSAGVEKGIKEAMSVNTGFIKNIVAYYGKIDPSTLKHVKKEYLPKIFIAMGVLDDIYTTDCNDAFINHAKELGYKVEIILHSRGEHGFDAFNEDEETINIINKTIKFIGNDSEKIIV